MIKSDIADIKNLGGPQAGAITAGKFLCRFTDYPWIHLDIAGASYTRKKIWLQRKRGNRNGGKAFISIFKIFNVMKKNKIGISIGDPNGVGMEIIIKTFKDNRILDFCTPLFLDQVKISSLHRKILKMQKFNFNLIKNIDKDVNDKKTNLINSLREDIDITLGDPTVKSGELAFKSFKSACLALKKMI